MKNAIKAVTVFCSSSQHVPRIYADASLELGRAIAANGWRLVYGGNCVGCMAQLADGARSRGGKVTGITPQLLVDKGISDGHCDELIVTPDMRQRKALLESHGDAYIALPGGLGTLEEVFEIIVARHLGYHQKPVCFLNISGYYNPMLAMIEHGIDQKFIKPSARAAYRVFASVADVIEHLKKGSEPI